MADSLVDVLRALAAVSDAYADDLEAIEEALDIEADVTLVGLGDEDDMIVTDLAVEFSLDELCPADVPCKGCAVLRLFTEVNEEDVHVVD